MRAAPLVSSKAINTEASAATGDITEEVSLAQVS